MADIKYTPEQLLAQSTEMTSVQTEFESLFQQTTKALNGINDSWSANLSKNFSGKIQAAQSSFSSIVNMLGNGSLAAKLGATSHSVTSIESFLSSISDLDKSIANYFPAQESTSAIDNQTKKELYDMLPESVQNAIGDVQNVDTWLVEHYDSLPDSAKSVIENSCPSVVKNTISVAHDIASGEVDASTVGKTVGIVTGNTTLGNVITSCYEAGTSSTADYFDQLSEEAEEKAVNCFKSGDIADGVLYTLEEAGQQTRKEGVALADATTNLIGSTLESTNIPIISSVGTALHNVIR